MPTQDIELIYNGPTDFPDLVINAPFDETETNDNDGTGDYVVVSVGYANTNVFYTNNGLIADEFLTTGNGISVLVNTGTIGGGSPFEDAKTA